MPHNYKSSTMRVQHSSKISYEERSYRKYFTYVNRHKDKMFETGNWNRVFRMLDRIYIHQHYELDDYRLEKNTYSTLKLFARHRSTPTFRECEKKFVDYIKTEPRRPLGKDETPFFPPYIPAYQVVVVDNTPRAIWQAFLLQNTFHFIIEIWHWKAYYEKRYFVFNVNDVRIWHGEEKPDFDKIKELISLPRFSTNEEMDNFVDDEINYLEYCYWNEWEGLVKEKVKIIYDDFSKTVRFEKVSAQVLYEYDCKFRYD